MRSLPEIVYFDANACFGRWVYRTPGAPFGLPGLLGELDHCRISRALVYHARARELDTRLANRALPAELGGTRRLVPAAVLNPGPYSHKMDLSAEVRELAGLGFKAFRVFPLLHAIDFRDPDIRKALGALTELKLPLWVDYDQLYINYKQLGQHEQRAIDLPAVETLAGDFPELAIVVVGTFHNHATRLFKVFDRCANVRAETSLFQGFGMLRYVCENWDAGRLLFGTGLPAISPGAARATLAYAGISAGDRQAIASGNLEKLLGLEPTASLAEDPGRSELLRAVDRGESLRQIPVYDVHGHIEDVGFEGLNGLTLGPQDAASIVRAIDRIGVDSIAVSSWQIMGGDAMAGNRTAWEAAERFPGRFMPYAVVNPNFPEDWPRTVEECFVRRRFFGLKPYPFSQRRALGDPAFSDMLSLADRLNLPILCHYGFEPLAGVTPGEIEELSARYPGARFIVAHAGASFRLADTVVPLARKLKNVYLEMNYTSVPFGMISYLVRNAGLEKILYGTDTPMRDPAPILGWVVYEHLTDAERQAILGGNFLRLIREIGYPCPST